MRVLAMTDPYANCGWGLLATFLGPATSVVFLVFAMRSALQFIRSTHSLRALSCMALGAIVIGSWWAVAPLARRWSGWTDPDGDGVLADFTNGSYDRFDVYGGHWGLLVLGVSCLCFAVLIVIRKTDQH
jgi:hypothetical protein